MDFLFLSNSTINSQLIRYKDLSQVIRRGTPMTHEDIKTLLSSYYRAGNSNLEKSSLAQNLNQLLEEKNNS